MGGGAKKKKAGPARPPAGVEQVVSLYALLTACGFAGSTLAVHAHSHHHNPCSRSWWHYSTNLTPAQATEQGRVVVVPAAAVGGGGGSRRALASWAALAAAAAATHCMYARLHLLFVAADPGDTLYRIVGAAGVLGYAACDMLAFLALLHGRGV